MPIFPSPRSGPGPAGDPDPDPECAGPRDYNRQGKSLGQGRGGLTQESSPTALAWAYWVVIAAAVVLLTSGLVGLFGTGASHSPDLSPEQAEYLRSNRKFLAIANSVAAIALGCTVPQMANGSQWGRRILAGVMGLACFINIGAIALGVGGLFLLFIPILLAIAAWLMFRPSANHYVQERTWEKRRIMD